VKKPYLTQERIHAFIDSALQEDVGPGDYSSLGAFAPNIRSTARLLIKDHGILAGVDLAQQIFARVDSGLQVSVLLADGTAVGPGQIGLMVQGKAQSILMAERLVLNCLQRMSGIATYTHQLCQLVAGTGARILDTRKTTPNFRMLEKWAVTIGGGTNHRFGLYDMIMLKDNHVDYAGGIRPAIEAIASYQQQHGLQLRVEIETRTLAEVEEVLATGGVDVIMLDNMDTDTLRQAVAMIGQRYETEASGGITEETIRQVAETGVDFISVGALTHSYKSIDMSLKAYDV